MASLTLSPGGQTRDFPSSTSLLDALLDMEVAVRTPCGGKGICGKCKIHCEGSLSGKTEVEQKATGDDTQIRLACQATLAGNATVFINEKESSRHKSYPIADPDDHYAVAIDIGTTSVSLSLVSLTQKKQLVIESFLNPQRRFGHDVISRIAAASDLQSRKSMTRQIRQAVFREIVSVLSTMKVSADRIKKIVFSGNTTMLYLFFGLDVSGLGRHPFKISSRDFNNITPADIDAGIFSDAQISALPVVSAFLGGDLLGGLALCHKKGFHENTFFIDLGTNGEMFLINSSGAIYGTSCAMGPALEGMNISCGMTADDGAITHARMDSGELAYTMMGEGRPLGLTGTALVDLVALFLNQGIIEKNGAFAGNPDLLSLPNPARFEDTEKTKQLRLWNDITLLQKDIRNMQLAKAASLTAAQCVLKQAGCCAEDVAHVLIAGALGSHLDMDNFRRLGFLPDFSHAAFHYLGNTSLEAAATACIDDQFLQKTIHLRDRVTEVALAANPEFKIEFISALNF